MKPRTTLILLVLAVAVGLYVKFFESKQPNTEEAGRRAQNVAHFDRTKIEGIVIQNGDDRIDLRRHDGKWRIEAPIKDQADSSVIDNVLNDAESWRKDTTISAKEVEADKNRLNEYGLIKPKLRLKLIGPDAPPEILFGKDSALEGRLYTRFENSKEVFIAAQNVKIDISKKPEEFRDKKLTNITTAQVTRAVLKLAAGEIELSKKNEHWQIVKPLQARGDDLKIADLLAQVTSAQIQEFVAEDRGDLHAYGLAEPRGSITLFAQDDKQGQALQIGTVPEKNKEQVYVRFVPRGSVYALPKKIEEILNTKPNDLRDRHLARIDSNMLDRLTIEPAGKPKIVLARKGESWTIASQNNQPANATEARSLIDSLNNEQVTKFVEDTASDLPKYGLDQPLLKITASSFASENTAETKAGEQPLLTLSFGKAEGDSVFARASEEPFIVAVRRSFLDGIWSEPVQFQDLSVLKFKPEEVHRLSVVTDRELSVERTGPNDWKWIAGDGALDKVNLQSLLNTLTSLHAVRWAAAADASTQGLDKPQAVITFTTSPDNKAFHKLAIGGPAGDHLWYAKLEERDGVFVLSNPDYTALRLPLTSSTSPSPAPSASVAAPAATP